MLLEHLVMVFHVHRIGCVWKTPFRKSGGSTKTGLIAQDSKLVLSHKHKAL